MTDFLEQTKREIRGRLAELKPLVDEYQHLEAAAIALDIPAANGAAAPARRVRGRRPGTTSETGRRGRPKGSGVRSKQALELVTATPGITIAELADAMKIKQNYLYRVLPALASEGLVTKRGRGWHPKQTAATEQKAAAPKAAARKRVARKPTARKPAVGKKAAA